MQIKQISQALCAMLLLCGCAFGQTIGGTLLGTVTDPSGAAVPHLDVEVKNLVTGATRTTVSGPDGVFRFNSLEPAKYDLTIKAPAGFKTYSQTNIDVTAQEVRDLGRIKLDLGAVTENISVNAAATPVQTASSENSALIDSNQALNVTLKGRDLFAMLVTLPGITEANTYLTGGDATSPNGGIAPLSMNGGGVATTNFTVDGIMAMDIGSNQYIQFEPTMDTIAEVKVLTTNYTAEYGRASGGQVTVITKSGSREFHGSAYAYKRHEMFNAKNFFNNYNNTPKSVYRFFVPGYSVGGPVYIPKVWNTQKKRVFFFWSQEYTRQKPATQSGVNMVPTSNIGANGSAISGMGAGQDQGNFFDRCAAGTGVNGVPCTAAYTDGNGVNRNANLVDPSNNKAALAGGNLSSLKGTQFYDTASAAYGQAILNYLPPPNLCTAAAGIYNGMAVSPSNCPAGYLAPNSPTWNYNYNSYWQYNEMGYLLDSGRPYILWSAPSAFAKHFTIDLYGAGPTATACSTRRRKSFPRLREFRRLKRNVNSSM